jgi:hypothetical protein
VIRRDKHFGEEKFVNTSGIDTGMTRVRKQSYDTKTLSIEFLD